MNQTSRENNSRPRIAIFSRETPSTTFIENLIEGLAEQGFEIYLFGYKRKKITYNNPNIKIFYVPEKIYAKIFGLIWESLFMIIRNPSMWFGMGRQVFSDRGFMEGLISLLEAMIYINRPVDIFHFQWAGDVEVYKELFGRLDSKIIVSFRGAHVNYAPLFRDSLKKSYDKYFPLVDAFHSVSEALAREGTKYGAPAEKIKVIYTSLNPNLNKFCQVDNKVIERSDRLRIISVGRFHWKKGYNYALDAMCLIKQQGIPFKYTIIAAGNIDEEFRYQIIQNGLEEQVQIINGLPQEELALFIKQHDVFLLPSVEEGIANVAIEAMALGTLVLTTDCGGMTEAIQDGVDGFVVPVRRSDKIAEKLHQIFNMGEDKKQNLRRKASERVEKQFSRDRMIQEFADLYTQLYNGTPL